MPAGRQPAELDREHHDQHQPDPEHRHGIGEDGEHRDARCRVQVRTHTRREQPEQRCRLPRRARATCPSAAASARAGPGSAAHRTAVAERIAEIERRGCSSGRAPSWTRTGWSRPNCWRSCSMYSGGRAAGFAREHVGGIAGRKLQQHEIQHDDAQHDGDRLQQTPNHERNSRAPPISCHPVLVTGIHRTASSAAREAGSRHKARMT